MHPHIAVSNALRAALTTYRLIGPRGLEKSAINAHGEQALVADWECEEAVIASLRTDGFPARVRSEEHGTIDLVAEPQYTVVLDGIDGTAMYKAGKGVGGGFGTLVGVLRGTNPKYADALVSGYALNGLDKLVVYSGGTNRTPDLRGDIIYADTGIDETFGISAVRDTFVTPLRARGYTIRDNPLDGTGVACIQQLLDLADGKARAVLATTRKGNLEQAALHRLLTDQGIVLETLDGKELSSLSYAFWGQGPREFIPYFAAHPDFADELRQALRK